MTQEMTQAIVITVSDSRSQGQREDVAGPTIAQALTAAGFAVKQIVVVPDDQACIEEALRTAAGKVRLVVTTGGTGIAPRDVTPEATRAICDRLLDGVAEVMRAEGLKETPFAALSRGLCGTRGQSLILNLPGNPRGAATSLQAVIHLLPHALLVLEGRARHGDALASAEESTAEKAYVPGSIKQKASITQKVSR